MKPGVAAEMYPKVEHLMASDSASADGIFVHFCCYG